MPARNIDPATKALADAIMRGEHDASLDYLASACTARIKNRFRKGAKVRLTGTSRIEIDGKVGTILKVNQKTVSVGIGDPQTEYGYTYYPEGEYNVPPRMLESVQA